MASIIIRGDFYFLKYKAQSGEWLRRKLPIRTDDPDAKRKCAMAKAAEEVREAALVPTGEKMRRGWAWVPEFIESHYVNEKTRSRAFLAWSAFSVFLDSRKISEPSLVAFAHGHEYVAWRQAPPAGCGIKKAAKNTAILEVKVAGRVMQHAVRLGLAPANPLYRLGLRKDPHKEKSEITLEEQARIEAALVDEPQWMQDAWLVAMKLGCRLRQTATLMADIDERAGTIYLPKQKNKRHLASLHPDLLPLVKRRRAEKAVRLVDLPEVVSVAWRRFFDRIGMPEHCFHDTRVTAITRLARAGIPEQQTKAYVGHASTVVHEVYTKLKAPDVAHLGKLL